MAPRGRRPRSKPRNSRMDAAIDAMTPYGFSEELVRKTVKELLELYGGEESWPVIEEGGYTSVLLDALLDARNKTEEKEEGGNDLETCPHGGNLLPDASAQENGAADPASLDISGPSCAFEPRGYEIITTASQTDNTAEGAGKDWKDIGLYQSSSQNLDATGKNEEPPKGLVNLPNSAVNSPPAVLHSTPSVGSVPIRRRKPCYGWIGDEDDDDFIYLPPAESFNPAPGKSKSIKRKTRWDVGPEDS